MRELYAGDKDAVAFEANPVLHMSINEIRKCTVATDVGGAVTPGFKDKSECKNTCAAGSSYTC
jgi:hypothetical protein